MSKYQNFKDAILAYQPDAVDAPLLLSNTELNEKAFKALLGRSLKSKGFLVAIIVVSLVILAGSVVGGFLTGGLGVAPAVFVPFIIVVFLLRTTLISVEDQGVVFYFIDSSFSGSKHTVYDKVTLPYDKITGVKTRIGSSNISFKFEFSHEGKTYKIKTAVPSKKKMMPEQEENVILLLVMAEKY